LPQLQVYEQGFVKEGVGAGGLAIAASLQTPERAEDLVGAIEELALRLGRSQQS
jgi:NaMN:DMB phosphoribosyltransferase